MNFYHIFCLRSFQSDSCFLCVLSLCLLVFFFFFFFLLLRLCRGHWAVSLSMRGSPEACWRKLQPSIPGSHDYCWWNTWPFFFCTAMWWKYFTSHHCCLLSPLCVATKHAWLEVELSLKWANIVSPQCGPRQESRARLLKQLSLCS